MRTPGFWKAGGSRIPALLLRPFGWIYGMATLIRLRKTGWRAPVPVISVGNFTAGGAGKTPTVIALAKALRSRGETPFVITRGYGGREAGPIRVDPASLDATAVGDEPLLIARHAPTIVSRNRASGARLACDQGASVLILDDALQNPSLEKDFSLAVTDGGFGFGNGECVPAGPLRAPVAPMLERVQGVLVIGDDETGAGKAIAPMVRVFSAVLEVDSAAAAPLSGQRVIAYCGIGRPEKFHASLQSIGANVIQTHDFADHHAFTEGEAAMLLDAATREKALLVTTEKDMARLEGSDGALGMLAARSAVLAVRVVVPDALIEMIYFALDSARKRTSTA